ncbi:AMP-binding protein [Micromonospora sp. WMMD964]|uniref:AMP-binding protein n=1 Tax=Micromonospora sp. WMMD964 TaxID=3016091 RepID=UPI00249C0DD7|nr:AMP-binding protein [Micromonospora sp. WMMD964]WFE98678.1 AMP-binding protein [Micromonospora sp. WMMD964]
MTDSGCLAVAHACPERPALVTDAETVTHGRLEGWTRQLTETLRARGVGPGTPVGIAVDDDVPGAVAALLATLRVGAAYTPRDGGTAPAVVLAADPGARPAGTAVVLPFGTAPTAPPVLDGLRVVFGGTAEDDVLLGDDGALSGRALSAYLRWALPAYPAAAGVAVLPALPGTAGELAALLVPLLAGGCVQLGELEDAAWSGWRPTFAKLTPADLATLTALPDEASPTGELVLTGPRLPCDEVARWRQRHPGTALTWEYVPVEGGLGCAALRLPAGAPLPDGPPVGLPLPGTTLRLLDPDLHPTPAGDVGELYVGGESVPALDPAGGQPTGVVVDPFGTRLRRTGDLGRRRPEGCVDLVGRAAVRSAPPVDTGDAAVVRDWESIYDQLYAEGGDGLGADFSGWNSSYTGRPIPLAEMREWQQATVDRIRALRPERVLEIGAGSGLLLGRLAAECEAYWATDLSGAVVRRLAEQTAARPDLRDRVVLRHQAAHDVSGLPAASFDLVVLNSVVQYFPTLDYLDAVLARVVGLLRPGGAVFVGDVRNARLAFTMQAAVRLLRAAPGDDPAQIRADVTRAVALDKELLVDPDFFAEAATRLDGVACVDVRVKRGRFHNELTRHRYDVVLHTAAPVRSGTPPVPCDLAGLPAALADGVPAVRVTGLVNARLAGEVSAAFALATGMPVAACQRRLDGDRDAVDPEGLAALGEDAGYEVTIGWSDGATDGSVDLLFTRSPAALVGAVGGAPMRRRAVPC